MRFLTGSIKDWEYIMKQAFDCLKPGGILESSEPSFLVESSDGTVNEESAWSGWYNIFERYGSTSGQTFSVVPQNVQVNAMNQAGFQNLEVFECEIPIGAWPQTEEKKKLGKYAETMMQTDMLGCLLWPCTSNGWTYSQIKDYSSRLQKEMDSMRTHPFFRLKSVWGRKL
nr:S-adenosyl-L-methionine-dependent [Colletotrichum truncatum]KAF6793949.1 S-adenosyl-L-methionine-dependent [Colletotrichum truncatum]